MKLILVVPLTLGEISRVSVEDILSYLAKRLGILETPLQEIQHDAEVDLYFRGPA